MIGITFFNIPHKEIDFRREKVNCLVNQLGSELD